MTTTIYGLIAFGDSVNGWRFRMFSRILFTSREAANKYKAEFRIKCCDTNEFDYAVSDTLDIEVKEFELQTEE